MIMFLLNIHSTNQQTPQLHVSYFQEILLTRAVGLYYETA